MPKLFLLVVMLSALTTNVDSKKSNNKQVKHKQPTGPLERIPSLAVIVPKFLGTASKIMQSDGFAILNIGLDWYKSVKEQQEQTQIFELMEAMQSIAQQINSKVDDALSKQSTTMNLLQKLPDELERLILENDIRKYLTDLDTINQQYQRYSTNMTRFNNYTLLNFAKSVVSHSFNSVESILAQIHAVIIPPHTGLRKKGILDHLADKLRNQAYSLKHCEQMQSAQQVYYNFYGNVFYARLRGSLVQMFGYTILKLFGKGSHFEAEANLFHNRYHQQITKEFRLVESHLKRLPRLIWKCDPSKHVRERTFTEISEFIQGFILNQIDMPHFTVCGRGCYMRELHYRSYCRTELCRRQGICWGRVRNCREFKRSDTRMDLWLKGYPNEQHRRYAAIATDGGWIGGSWSLVKDSDTKIRAEPFSRFPLYRHWCKYCACNCHHYDDSNRIFSLRPTIANITENHVVTGLRFVKYDGIVHLQIQEGRLLPNGDIGRSTVRWVPVNRFKKTDKNINANVHYIRISREDGQGINLDDVLVENGKVIVGVRLIRRDRALTLSLATARFNFTKEVLTLDAERPQWTTSHLTANRRNIYVENNQVSYDKDSKSIPYHTPSLTWFVPTGWKEDAAQRAVPSLDIQPVESADPMPLQGAGLYFKSEDNGKFGGFIAPRIFTYDILNYWNRDNSPDKT